MIKTFVCAVCNQEFGEKEYLLNHLFEEHSHVREELSNESILQTLKKQFPNRVVKVKMENDRGYGYPNFVIKYCICVQYNDDAWIFQHVGEKVQEDDEDEFVSFGLNIPIGIENAIEELKEKIEMVEWIESEAKKIGFKEFSLIRHDQGYSINDEDFVFEGLANGRKVSEYYTPYDDSNHYMSPQDFIAKLRHYFVNEVKGEVKWVVVDSYYEPTVDGIYVHDLLRGAKRVRIEILEREANDNA